MQTYELLPHPTFAPKHVSAVTCRWSPLNDGRMMLRYRVDGCGALVAPEFRGKGRGDELWRTTCFELFLNDGAGRYREFNFSPSQQWAAYAFAGYRACAGDHEPLQPPEIAADRGHTIFAMTVFIDRCELLGAASAALSAVIEEDDGRLSYWALAHGGLKPDFHDPACFRIPLAPAGAA